MPCLFDHSLSFSSLSIITTKLLHWTILTFRRHYIQSQWQGQWSHYIWVCSLWRQSKRKCNLPHNYFWLWFVFRLSSVYSSVIWLPNQPSSCSTKNSNPKFTYLSFFILQLLSMNTSSRQGSSEMSFSAICTFSSWYIETINRNLNFFVLCHATSYFLSSHFSSKDIMEWFSKKGD